jgi:hypothetical protein
MTYLDTAQTFTFSRQEAQASVRPQKFARELLGSAGH